MADKKTTREIPEGYTDAPILTDEDEEILDRVWAKIAAKEAAEKAKAEQK